MLSLKLTRHALRQRARKNRQSPVEAKLVEVRRLNMMICEDVRLPVTGVRAVYAEVVEATVVARKYVPDITVDQVIALITFVAVESGLSTREVEQAVLSGFMR